MADHDDRPLAEPDCAVNELDQTTPASATSSAAIPLRLTEVEDVLNVGADVGDWIEIKGCVESPAAGLNVTVKTALERFPAGSCDVTVIALLPGSSATDADHAVVPAATP